MSALLSSRAGAEAGAGGASWYTISEAGRSWAEPREPRPGDVPLVFYRDANSWCPFSHRVWFMLEQKGLRYRTERIHLVGDPREPSKPEWYFRDVAPRGNVPALRINGEVVLESLDILEVRLSSVAAGCCLVAACRGEWAG